MTLWQIKSQRRDDDGYDDIHAFVKNLCSVVRKFIHNVRRTQYAAETQDVGMLFIITHFIIILLLDVINHAFIVLRIHNVVDNVHA